MAEDTKAPDDDKADPREQPDSREPSNPTSGPPPKEEPPRVSIPRFSAPPGAAWGLPLKKFMDRWTHVETYLCVVVIVAEILALVAWVVLKGLGTPKSAGTPTGTIVRAVLGATALGIGSYFATRKQSLLVQRVVTSAAIVAGLMSGGLWASVGVSYFANVLNWLQSASSLTLIGGLRGLGTRLTIWLAMLGGSLAAASGKHIHIDVVMRFIPRKARLGTTLVTWVAAATVCFAAAWGFVDHVAIESYDVDRDAPMTEKLSAIGHHTSVGMFVLRKQLGLDLSTLPSVLAGTPYDGWLTNEAWNKRVQDAGWEDHFTSEQVATLTMPADFGKEYRLPLVIVPGSTQQGMLKHLLNLVFPFGFFIIGIRFLLRGVLAVSGHVDVDPDAVHAHGAPTVVVDDDAAAGTKEGAA